MAFIKIFKIIKSAAFLIILIIGALAILSSANPTVSGIIPLKPFTVLSGSMRPTIYEGSITFVDRKAKEFRTGDIITFIRPDNPKENVTHRIEKIEISDNRPVYFTKGDANKASDTWQVKPEAIWGKVAFSVPLLGFAISFTQTKLGVILIIVLPLSIIILDELRIIYDEIKKIQKRRLEKQNHKNARAATTALIAPLLFLLSAGNTHAFFTDTVEASNLKISTGSWIANDSCDSSRTVIISSNGAGSQNEVEINNNCTLTINQSNNTIFNKSINSSSSTGNNQASHNANVQIRTGDAINEININVTSGTNSANINRP